MKEYRVLLTCTEVYSVYVMAESDEAAIEEATNQFNEGKLEVSSEHFEAVIDWEDDTDWEDDGECDR